MNALMAFPGASTPQNLASGGEVLDPIMFTYFWALL